MQDSKWFTVPEVANHLRCSPGHVYRLIAVADLPAVQVARPRRSWRVSQLGLSSWIQSRTTGAGL